jgi:hypothetical protein
MEFLNGKKGIIHVTATKAYLLEFNVIPTSHKWSAVI